MVSGLVLKSFKVASDGPVYYEIMNKPSTKRMLLASARRVAKNTTFNDPTGKMKPRDLKVDATCVEGRKRAHAYTSVYRRNPKSFKEMYRLRSLHRMARNALLKAFSEECDSRGYDFHER